MRNLDGWVTAVILDPKFGYYRMASGMTIGAALDGRLDEESRVPIIAAFYERYLTEEDVRRLFPRYKIVVV